MKQMERLVEREGEREEGARVRDINKRNGGRDIDKRKKEGTKGKRKRQSERGKKDKELVKTEKLSQNMLFVFPFYTFFASFSSPFFLLLISVPSFSPHCFLFLKFVLWSRSPNRCIKVFPQAECDRKNHTVTKN